MSPEETLSQPDVSGSSGAVSPPVASGIECPACGTQNTSDSKFCRHCGHLLRSLSSGAPADAKKVVVAADADEEEEVTSPEKIDERRAHGLLDRALAHSERGDINAAILACRQAIALDHNHAEPYALLGTLLERSGDLRGAMSAYEHVLEIEPHNELERDSLNRLKARVDKMPPFHFNSAELFASEEVSPLGASSDEETQPRPEAAPAGIEARLPPTSSSAQIEEAAPAAETTLEDLVFDFSATPASATPSVSPLTGALSGETVSRVEMPAPPSPVPAATSSGNVPKIERRYHQRRQVALPVATERRVQGDRRASASRATGFAPSVWPSGGPSASRTSSPAPVIAPLDFSFSTAAAPPAPLWARFMRDSSFFVRALPLIVVGVMGLSFLGWARSQAVAGDASTVVAQTDDTTIVPNDAGQPPIQTNVVPGVVAPTPGVDGGLAITNATSIPAPPSVVTPNAGTSNQAPASSAPSGNTNAAPTSSSGSSGGRQNTGVPSFPRPLPPAAVPPPSVSNSSGNRGNSGGNTLILPAPQTGGGEAPAPRIRVGGGVPLNPGGSPQERIRITQGSLGSGRSAPLPRTGSVARGEERDASSAAANGNQDRVINSLTNAINASGGDQGYLLQQRAMAFMDRGDYGRAAEDFQAAVDAYQNQINNGENVAAAQAGLRAARSGLSLAQAQR